MAKFVSPLLGFNNNVRHKNRVFHIQTEDSGINHPHIITHLFMDGGRILKSVKTSYAEHVGTEKMSDTVRQMMKEQHKAMFIALRDGQFDHLVDGGAPKATKSDAAAKAVVPATSDAKVEAAKPAAPATAAVGSSDTEETQRLPAQTPEAAAAALEPAPKTEPAPVTADGPFRAAASAAPPPVAPTASSARLGIAAPAPVEAAARVEETPSRSHTASGPPVAPVAPGSAPPASKVPSVRDLTLDFDALESATPKGGAPLFRDNDLPPPPANMFAKHPSGGYRDVEREEPASSGASPAARPSPAPHGAAPARAPDQRYAPARPAAIFGASATRPQPASLFSDELISDKSLDEVILSYLAEDLEPPRRK